VTPDNSSMNVQRASNRAQSYGKTTFRRLNENVRLLVAQFQEPNSRAVIAFVCECYREHCFATVEATLAEYTAICADDAHRLIRPGHEHDDEQTVILTPRYAVVRLAEAFESERGRHTRTHSTEW